MDGVRMGYIEVPPKCYQKGREGRRSGKASSTTPPPPTPKTVYKRDPKNIPDVCRTCDNNYRLGLIQEFTKSGGKVGLYDIDLVLEVAGRIRMIGEYKRFRREFKAYMIPGYQYVALKKIAKMMKVACILIVELVADDTDEGSEYLVWTIDRFEGVSARPLVEIEGKRGKWALFDPYSAVRLNTIDALTEWITNTFIDPSSEESD